MRKKERKKQIIMMIKKVMWRMLEQVPDSRLGLLAQVSLVHICQNSCVLISHHSWFHMIIDFISFLISHQSWFHMIIDFTSFCKSCEPKGQSNLLPSVLNIFVLPWWSSVLFFFSRKKGQSRSSKASLCWVSANIKGKILCGGKFWRKHHIQVFTIPKYFFFKNTNYQHELLAVKHICSSLMIIYTLA